LLAAERPAISLHFRADSPVLGQPHAAVSLFADDRIAGFPDGIAKPTMEARDLLFSEASPANLATPLQGSPLTPPR
jgi:hypothetical protein